MPYTFFKKLFRLFYINFFISAFTFGGGYVVIPMMRKYFVENTPCLSEEELMDMAAIAQSSPGAIAVNLASLVGYKIVGFVGALCSCIASVLPALIILSIISSWYGSFADNSSVAAVLKGMEAGVAALIVNLVLDMYRLVLQEKSRFLALLVPLVFIGNYFFNINVAFLLAATSMVSIISALLVKRRSPVK